MVVAAEGVHLCSTVVLLTENITIKRQAVVMKKRRRQSRGTRRSFSKYLPIIKSEGRATMLNHSGGPKDKLSFQLAEKKK